MGSDFKLFGRSIPFGGDCSSPLRCPEKCDGSINPGRSGEKPSEVCIGRQVMEVKDLQRVTKSRNRWKYLGAEEYAVQNPLSSSYKQLQSAPPLEAMWAHTSILVFAGPLHAELLKHSCFGRPILAAPTTFVHLAHQDTCEDIITNTETQETVLFEVNFEEAFFLCRELRCLQVYYKTKEDRTFLSHIELWRLCLSADKGFPRHFKVYSHLRAKKWVVRGGLQYGADFVAYRHHPSQVHSEYAVIVMSDERTDLITWVDILGKARLCASVAKTLLLLYVIPKRRDLDDQGPDMLENLVVHERVADRWFPEKHREEVHSIPSAP